MRKKYFLLYEICFLSLMSALVYVFKTFFKTPIGLSGHNGLVWVIPFIVGVGVTRKFGSSTYIGVLSGLLIGTIGMSDEGIFKVFEWIALGVTVDIMAFVFKGHLTNLLVGLLIGAFGNLAKGAVNFSLGFLTPNANILLLGFAPAMISHVVFGAAGGVVAAIIVNRVQHVSFGRKNPAKTKPPEGTVARLGAFLQRMCESVAESLL
jgi:hypothetical protein